MVVASRDLSGPDESGYGEVVVDDLGIRDDVVATVDRAWDHLAGPGTWWSGSDRLALAAATRDAWSCGLCRERKAAVSPYAVRGRHGGDRAWSEVVLDAVHRIATDPGRLTRRWFDEVVPAALDAPAYVEAVAVVATVTALDTFARALGTPTRPLPAARPGDPGGQAPPEAVLDDAWVPTLPPEAAAGALASHYARLPVVPGIYHALSLVPDEQVAFLDLACAMYVPHEDLYDFEAGRSLSRAQLEVVSTTVSSLNDCHY